MFCLARVCVRRHENSERAWRRCYRNQNHSLKVENYLPAHLPIGYRLQLLYCTPNKCVLACFYRAWITPSIVRHEIPPSKTKVLLLSRSSQARHHQNCRWKSSLWCKFAVRAVCIDRRALITIAIHAALLGMRLYIAGIRYFRTEQTLILQTSLDQLFDLLEQLRLRRRTSDGNTYWLKGKASP